MIKETKMTKKYVFKNLGGDIEYNKTFLCALVEGVNGFGYTQSIRIPDYEREDILKYWGLMTDSGFYDNGHIQGEVRCTQIVTFKKGKQSSEYKMPHDRLVALGIEKEVA